MIEVTPAEIAGPVVKKAISEYRNKRFHEALEGILTYFMFEPIDRRFFQETEQHCNEALLKAFGIDFTGKMKIVSTVHDSVGFLKGDRLDRFLKGELCVTE